VTDITKNVYCFEIKQEVHKKKNDSDVSRGTKAEVFIKKKGGPQSILKTKKGNDEFGDK